MAGLILPTVLAVLILFSSSVTALQYYIGNPSQCQPLNLTWSDAKGTLHLLIVPVEETSQGFIQNITLPSDATSPYTFNNFTQPAGMNFMAAMWDDEGYAATGVTEVLTVGSSDNSSCLRGPGSILPDFFFYTSTENPAQCSNVDITWQSTYTPPTYIVGMIPGGDIWNIHSVATSGTTAYSWTANVKQGTRMLLTMPDAGLIGTGGSTSLWTIGSGSTSCLTNDSPASITSSPTQTTGSSATPSVSGIGGGGGRPGSPSAGHSGNGGSGGSSSGGSNIGAIVGGVVGGVAALVILGLLAFCLLRRRRRQQNGASRQQKGMFTSYITPGGATRSSGGGGMFDRGRRNTQADIDLLGAGEDAHGHTDQEFLHNSNDDSPGSYEPQPYLGGFQYANTAPTSSGFPATRTSHESQPTSDTNAGRSGTGTRPHSFGLSDFGNFASAESEGVSSTGTHQGHPGMSSVGDHVTGASPQLPGSPLPIASMYPSPNSPSAPQMESPGGPAAAGRSNSTRKRRPAAAVGPDGRPATRFVLHQDAGEIEDPGPEEVVEGDVVEMPPRYDELRPGTKASVENLNR